MLVGTALLTWLATAGTGNLPSLYLSTNNRQTAVASNGNVFLWVLSIAAVVLLLVRRRTILDLWLIVVYGHANDSQKKFRCNRLRAH